MREKLGCFFKVNSKEQRCISNHVKHVKYGENFLRKKTFEQKRSIIGD